MRIQIELHELTEILQLHKDTLERAARAEGALYKSEEHNRNMVSQIRGLEQRIENISRDVQRMNIAPEGLVTKMTLQDTLARVCRELANGAKINAIKIVREHTGLGLKEAKNLVEGLPITHSSIG